MKVSIDIDLTPQEAREMLGLPNVQKIQDEWLAKVEEKILGDAENFAPEKILQSWVAGASANADMFTGLLDTFLQGGKGK